MNDWIEVATDGACAGNPGPAGWAWIVNDRCWEAGSLGRATNNVAELDAVRRVLIAAPTDVKLLILADSQYTINVITKWSDGWARNNWRRRDGKPVQNRRLIEELAGRWRARQGTVKIEWVRGHAGHPLNNAADMLAVKMREMSPREALVTGPGWVSP